MKNARVLTHQKTLTKSFRVIQYDTTHYSSLKAETKEMEIMLKKNSLPKMDRMLYDCLRILGRKEKDPFEKHSIKKLVEIFDGKAEEFPEEVDKIKAYLDKLNVDEIVTPVRKITDFIQDDLIATSPSYLGQLLPQYHRVNGELRKITNSPVKPTGSFMKIIVVILIVGMIGAVAFIAYDQGVFDGITSFTDSLGTIGDGLSALPSPGAFQIPSSSSEGIDYSDEGIRKKYDTPEKLKIAVNNGEVEYDKLSNEMQKSVDSIELPVLELPTP